MKRLVSGLLWFLSVWCMYELLVSVVGAPRVVGPFLGLAAAAVILVDPLDRIWGASRAMDRPALDHAGQRI